MSGSASLTLESSVGWTFWSGDGLHGVGDSVDRQDGDLPLKFGHSADYTGANPEGIASLSPARRAQPWIK